MGQLPHLEGENGSAAQESSCLLQKQTAYCHAPNQTSPVLTFAPVLFQVHFTIVLPFVPRPPKWRLLPLVLSGTQFRFYLTHCHCLAVTGNLWAMSASSVAVNIVSWNDCKSWKINIQYMGPKVNHTDHRMCKKIYFTKHTYEYNWKYYLGFGNDKYLT